MNQYRKLIIIMKIKKLNILILNLLLNTIYSMENIKFKINDKSTKVTIYCPGIKHFNNIISIVPLIKTENNIINKEMINLYDSFPFISKKIITALPGAGQSATLALISASAIEEHITYKESKTDSWKIIITGGVNQNGETKKVNSFMNKLYGIEKFINENEKNISSFYNSIIKRTKK